MSLLALFALAVALSMDAFAVSVASGIRLRKTHARGGTRMSLAFGFFQFLMPLIGWMLGLGVRRFIENWDHWVAFGLLTLVGLNMLREAFSHDACGKEDAQPRDPSKGWTLLLLAVATSIDALAVGLSFSLVEMPLPVWAAAALIGVVCTLISGGGIWLGRLLASACVIAKRAEMLGGVILIVIALRILGEHGVF